MGGTCNMHGTISVGISAKKKPFGRLVHKWKGNSKMHLKEMRNKGIPNHSVIVMQNLYKSTKTYYYK
jgi:hypothetical protein